MLQAIQPREFSDLDQQVFKHLVPTDHFLRTVKETIDFECFRGICEDAYEAKTMGRPAIDVVLMLKILYLRFHFRLSDRQVMVRAETDAAFRFFMDLPCDVPVPNHTTSTYFRNRLGPERFEKVFQELVGQARARGLVRDRLRLKDATHMLGDVADLRPLQRVAQVRDRLLDAAEEFFPAWVVDQHQHVETLRQSTAELGEKERLAHRLVYLRDITQALQERVASLPVSAILPDRKRDRLADALGLAEKLLSDHDDPDSKDRLMNAVDADARKGFHHGYYIGFMMDVAIDADSEIITAINVLPANGAEAADTLTLIRQEENAQGNDVAGVSIDGAGFNGPLLRELTDPEGLNIEVTVPPTERPTTKYRAERFSLNVVGQLECPAGQTTSKREKVPEGIKFRFHAKICTPCPLREECLDKPEANRGRTVIKNAHEAEYAKAKAKAQTPEYAKVRKEHPRIERKLADLVRNHGARRAVYRGLGKVRIQAFMTALVANVKRMIRLLSKARADVPIEASGIAVRAELC